MCSPLELVDELAESHTVTPHNKGPTPNFHHFTGRLPSLIHVMLLRGIPSPLQAFDPVRTPAGRQVLAGLVDLYHLGGWRHPDLDDTVAVAASVGDTHSVLVAVRAQVSDNSAALALLDAAWVDLNLPE